MRDSTHRELCYTRGIVKGGGGAEEGRKRRVVDVLEATDFISKSWKVCYSLAAPGDRIASSARVYNEL